MRKILLLICMLLLLLPAGCTRRETAGSTADSSQNTAKPMPAESGTNAAFQELKSLCEGEMYRLLLDSTLFGSWEGTPIVPNDPPMSIDLTITELSREADIITVTAELYGNIHIDPVTLEETIGYGTVWIKNESDPSEAGPAFGKSVVRFKDSAGDLTPISCVYEKYPHPGLDYLKAQTEMLQPLLSASEKIDVSQYDKLLVNYIWQVLFAHRYIEKPEDITLYDLENLRDGIELPYGSIYDAGYVDAQSQDYRMDASLLKLTPNLESVNCPFRLKDYGVFENMRGLKKLTLSHADDEVFRTLKVGYTDELVLYDPDFDTLDMTNINTEILRLNSWSTAVRGFTGCGKIKKLYIMSTRTDMRLISADTFPGVSYLNLYFYSDTPRVRDFSRLGTFNGVKIDLYLDYQACNNKTLESLQGVKLNDVYLNPENGSYPLRDLDDSLTEKLDAKSVTIGMEMYFQERTGEVDRPYMA